MIRAIDSASLMPALICSLTKSFICCDVTVCAEALVVKEIHKKENKIPIFDIIKEMFLKPVKLIDPILNLFTTQLIIGMRQLKL